MTINPDLLTDTPGVVRPTRLQERCPDCGKVAVEKFSFSTVDKKTGDEIRLITLECFHIIKRIIPKATEFDRMVSNDWKDSIKNCNHKWNKTVCEVCGEFKLYNFQVIGARFTESALATSNGAGIFDEMGLGKTIQALAVIKYHPEYTPTLYVVKSAIKFQWFKEIVRWLGPDYLAQVIATGKDYVFPNLKSYIIAYDLLRRFPREKIDSLGIKLVVLDECQQIKNADSTRTQEVRRLVSGAKVIPLSGTPWKNRGSEFYPVLNMLDPMKFSSQAGFINRWVDVFFEGNKRKEGGIRNIEAFKEYVRDIVIRREYDEVMDEFPAVSRLKLNVQLDDLAQNTYDDEVSEFVKWYNDKVIGGEEDSIDPIALLARMSRMRHITGLAKIPATISFTEDFIEDTSRKLVIFVHHKDVGHLIFEELKKLFGNRIRVMKLVAEMSDEERFATCEEFNSLDRAIMVASTLASGEGLNLQSCSDAVMHERQWNPQNEDQAAPGRFKRIGQKSNSINVTFVEAEATIDEQLNAIVEGKRINFHNAMNKSELPQWNQSEFAKELAESIVAKYNREKNKGKITAKANMKPKVLQP